ncbi:MAG: hypothetical protein WAQ57_00125 [Candidatus Saccharimonadales bacterium]
MTIPSRYFHNRSILLLLIINSVLVLLGSLLILFRLDSNTTTNYIIEYRANLGIAEYEIGSALDMAGFVFFLLINFAICVFISLRAFVARKHVAVMILAVSALLSLLTIIVSLALLGLR